MARIATLALARTTFDIPFARELADIAYDRLEALGHEIVGPSDLLLTPRELLTDNDKTKIAIESLSGQSFDLVLVIQVTFTDAEAVLRIASGLDGPIAVWAFPEERTGQRLRLNSFCGLNLAAHALGRAEIPYRTLYMHPSSRDLRPAVAGLLGERSEPLQDLEQPAFTENDTLIGERVADTLRDTRIGLVGEHPPGFVTCAFEPEILREDIGVSVDPVSLETVFARAKEAAPEIVETTSQAVFETLQGARDVDQRAFEKSMRVHTALKSLTDDRDLKGLAVRCWPEMFTEYGCAACGPMAMLNEDGIPAACEADVYGATTALMLQLIADEPSLLVDIVDMDSEDDTAVFWHCGLAPVSMASRRTPPAADIHSNRKMPLLHTFALKPGRVTIARLSQSKNVVRLVIGAGEMIEAPKSFSGTSGVIRFDRPTSEVRQRLLDEGLEHHVAFAYGDHRGALASLAARLELPVLTLA